MKDGSVTCDEIGKLVDFTKKNGGIDYAESVMSRFSDEARELIAGYSNNGVRAALKAYVDFVAERKM